MIVTRESRHLREDVTHWTNQGSDGYGGQSWSAPAPLKGRWEDHVELVVQPGGKEEVSQARIYLSADVVTGDYLALGVHTDADPTTVDGAWRVLHYMRNTDLRNLNTERKAML